MSQSTAPEASTAPPPAQQAENTKSPIANTAPPLSAKAQKEAKQAEKRARRAEKVGEKVEVQAKAAAQTQKGQGQGQQLKKPALAAAKHAPPPPPAKHAPPEVEPVKKILPFFSHLEDTRTVDISKVHKDVHPSILQLSLKFKNFEIVGSTARCYYMLQAFQEVIRDYVTPPQISLPRNLAHHLNRQINLLITSRPLSVCQGNAIRWLKNEIAKIDVAMPEAEAKEYLVGAISKFMKERISFAHEVISHLVAEEIKNGDVVLTYAKSSTVEKVLLQAHRAGKRFSVIVVDSRPYFEGKNLVKTLAGLDGIDVTYTLIHGLSSVLPEVTRVMLGASAVFANGSCFSRIGTAMVAMMAHKAKLPVMVCCEALKLTDKVALDSIVMNELGPSDALVNVATGSANFEKGPLANYADLSNLHLVSPLYDVTPAKLISAVVTELGPLPPTSVTVILNLITEAQTS